MDISNTDLLLGITEFSIGLAGFSGIVAALAHRSGKWAQVDRYRIGNLLYSGLSPGFLAFFALGIGSHQLATWQLSSGALALVLSYGMYVTIYGRKILPATERVLISIPIFYAQRFISLVALVCQLLAVFGYFGGSVFTVFYFGLIAQLFVATIQFARIIFVRPK